MRSAILAVVVLLVAVQSFAQFFTVCPEPGPGQVAFFEDIGFGAKCVVKGIGNYPTSSHLGIANDSISSIKLGSGAQVLVCSDAWYEGQCELFTATAARLSDHPIGNDSISSAKVQPRGASITCEPQADQVAFFHDDNFSGPCEVRVAGEYRHSEEIGLSNDSISSVKVGSGMEVLLCKDANFSGDCELLTASDPHLGDNRVGNDAVSSARVEPRGADPCQPGADSVAVFQHASFTPPCAVRGPGDYPHSENIGLMDNSMSSIRVGRNTQVLICRDANYSGDCQLLTASMNHLDQTRIGDNSVSSMKVQRIGFNPCPVDDRQVAFYQHGSFTEPCRVKGEGDYRDAASIGLPDRSISSINLGRGVKACVCDSESFKGKCIEISSSSPHLDNFNDSIASAAVRDRSARCPFSTPPPPVTGFRAINVTNCDPHTVSVWMSNVLEMQWVKSGTMPAAPSSGDCPQKQFALENGKTFEIAVVDPQLTTCDKTDEKDQPGTAACRRLSLIVLTGSSSGSIRPVLVP